MGSRPRSRRSPARSRASSWHNYNSTCTSTVIRKSSYFRAVARSSARSAAGNEDVLAALVVDRLFFEVSVQSFELKLGNIEEAEPLVLGRPPDGAGAASIERDVDAVSTDCIANDVGHGPVLVPSVQSNANLVVERESVPGEPAAGPQ